MSKTDKQVPQYEFSEKYDEEHAKSYFEKHDDGFWRRMSNALDHRICVKALKLAGNPSSILDMPCGTGRFWELLAEDPSRKLYASDNSQDMINTALKHRPTEIASRFETFQGSAFDLPVADDFVENIFCIRLLHHIGEHEDRVKILKELARVASKTVIVSLWVDGNFKAIRRNKLEARRKKGNYQNRFVVPVKTFESEVQEAGMEIIKGLDFIPYYAMWRTYVLKVK
tara:strand:- start:43520 stop:44200 length:681 start_codon:yes stop_codon:yes gene_type:complete